MNKKSMTAMVCCFARAYHSAVNDVKVFDDTVAGSLLTDEEYRSISKSMSDGIGFFDPAFNGTPEEALRYITDNQLSPSPLGRAAFCEGALERAVNLGTTQYLILGAGYDTFAYRQPKWAKGLEIYETDLPEMSADKEERLKKANIPLPENLHFIHGDITDDKWVSAILAEDSFSVDKKSFASVLGVVYYISQEAFKTLLLALRRIFPEGSAIVFDYPDEKNSERSEKQAALAKEAREEMKCGYSTEEIEKLLEKCGFMVCEHLTPAEMTEQYFSAYNKAVPAHPMTALENVNYCLAVRK